ncbi:MAG: terminase large subunit [bacterium]|nr:terminase large subunit [bacterium]
MTELRTEPIHDWEFPPEHRAIGELERLVYERHHRDLATGDERGIWFDDAAAQFAFDFFLLLPLTKGRKWSGKPFDLLNWERLVVGLLWGWKRIQDDGDEQLVVRRFRTAYLQIGKKNGKTELMAGVGDMGLLADGEPGAEVYSLAITRTQSKLVWTPAAQMVLKSPSLASRCDVRGVKPNQVSNIYFPALNAKFEPLSREVGAQDGVNPSLLIVDEFHRFKDRDQIDMLDESMATRVEPLTLFASTAGAGSTGPCRELRDYSEKVLKGIVEDDQFFTYVTEPDKGDEWDTEIAWEKANPSIDVLIRRAELREKCKTAKEIPSKQNDFQRYRCNLWTGQIKRAIKLETWDECGKPFDPLMLLGRPCFGGLDVGSKADLAAFALLFPPVNEDDDPNWHNLIWLWTPAAGLRERSKKDRAMYPHWVDKGFLIADETGNGEIIRNETIERQVLNASELYNIQECAFDPWKAADIAQNLQDAGLTMVELAQVIGRLTVGTKFLLEDLLPSRRLRHGGHPPLRWMVSNFAIYEDTNRNIRPSRQNSGGKIDGLSALVNACCRGALVKPKKPSGYKDRGYKATTLGSIG